MAAQVLSRVTFGIMPLGFAWAATVGPGPAGVAHLAGVLALGVVILWRKEAGAYKKALKSRKLLLSGLLFALLNAIGGSAMAIVPLPTFSVMVQLVPLVGILIAPLFAQGVRSFDLLALPVAVLGGALAVGGTIEDVPLLGWALLAGEIILVAFSVHLFAWARRSEEQKVLPAVAAMMTWGCPLLLLQPGVLNLPALALLALAGSGLMLALGNSLIYATFDRFPAHRTLLLSPITTVTTISLAVLLLGQTWSETLLVGGVLILLAGILVGWAQRGEELSRSRR